MGHRNFAAATMMAMACFIIVLHSVVPHHHHDCCDGGLVFENELRCTHDHHNHDCDHHDGCCKLQDLLSQLVISTKDDKFFLAGCCQQLAVSGQLLAVSGQWEFVDCGRRVEYYDREELLPLRFVTAERLRGPPVSC